MLKTNYVKLKGEHENKTKINEIFNNILALWNDELSKIPLNGDQIGIV